MGSDNPTPAGAAPGSDPHLDSAARPPRLVRVLVEHFWLLALPLLFAVFLAVVHLGNPFNLSFLPSPTLVLFAVAALVVSVVMGVPYLIWRRDFDQAREDVALLRDAQLGAKDARRRMRRYGSRLKPHARERVTQAIEGVERAAAEERGLPAAVSELEAALEEHLHFGRKGPFREYAESIGVAVFIALLLRAFVVEAFKIPSGSMIPTLEVGDHIFVNKFVYGVRIPWTNIKLLDSLRLPRRGEVVVFIYPQEPDKDFIKRIVAVAGDTVDIKGGQVIINGQPVPHTTQPGPCEYEDYTEETGEWTRGRCEAFKEVNSGVPYTVIQTARGSRGPGVLSFPLTVPPRSVFVMGDNRDNSHDSRYWGFVPYDLIKGKAWIIWWSAGKGSSVRMERMFKLIHP